MENNGSVSLWVSDEADEIRVESAFEVDYTEDGDWISPPFAKAFGFVRFNPATREANVLPSSTNSVRQAVAGCSYASLIAERFAQVVGELLPYRSASVALLYDFEFSGTPSSAVINGSTWTYVCCVRYVH